MMRNNQYVVLFSLMLLSGCAQAPASSAAQTSASSAAQPASGLSIYSSPAVVAWLDCVECTPDQLKAVAALGDRAVSSLNETLLNGPPKDRVDQEQKHLEASYAATKDYEREHPDSRMPFTQQEYVQLYMQKFVLLNRARSASALGAIATDAARTSLRSASQQQNLPAEVRREIERALAVKPSAP